LSIVACQKDVQNGGIFSMSVSPHKLSRLWCSGLVLLWAAIVVAGAVFVDWAVMMFRSCCIISFGYAVVFVCVFGGGGACVVGFFGIVCWAQVIAHFIRIVSYAGISA